MPSATSSSSARTLRQASISLFFSPKPPPDHGVPNSPPSPTTPDNTAMPESTRVCTPPSEPSVFKRKQLQPDSNSEPPSKKNNRAITVDPVKPSPPPMTDYEYQRQENIRRNNEFFKTLGIVTPGERPQKRPPPRPKIKSPQIPQPAVPLRRSKRWCSSTEIEAPLEVFDDAEDRILDLPTVQYDDSCVLKYMCSAMPEDKACGFPSSATATAELVGFRRVGKELMDPALTKIYTVDVAVLDGGSSVLLAAGGHAGGISVYGTRVEAAEACENETEQPLMTWKGCRSWISGVRLLKRGSMVQLLSSSNDGGLVVWDISKEPSNLAGQTPPIVAEVDNLHSRGIFGMQEFNGRIATASKDSSVGFCSLRDSGIEVDRTFSGHHRGPIRGICFRDSDILADCGADNRICILDLRQSKSCTLTIESDHYTGVNVVEWCPSQEHLFLSASKDPGILLYDVRSPEQPLYKLQGHVDLMLRKCSQIYRPAFVGNGMTVATPGQGSRQITLYSAKNGKAISRGFVGYDANLVMCNVKDKAESQRVWLAGKQITQLCPLWRTD